MPVVARWKELILHYEQALTHGFYSTDKTYLPSPSEEPTLWLLSLGYLLPWFSLLCSRFSSALEFAFTESTKLGCSVGVGNPLEELCSVAVWWTTSDPNCFCLLCSCSNTNFCRMWLSSTTSSVNTKLSISMVFMTAIMSIDHSKRLS